MAKKKVAHTSAHMSTHVTCMPVHMSLHMWLLTYCNYAHANLSISMSVDTPTSLSGHMSIYKPRRKFPNMSAASFCRRVHSEKRLYTCLHLSGRISAHMSIHMPLHVSLPMSTQMSNIHA